MQACTKVLQDYLFIYLFSIPFLFFKMLIKIRKKGFAIKKGEKRENARKKRNEKKKNVENTMKNGRRQKRP